MIKANKVYKELVEVMDGLDHKVYQDHRVFPDLQDLLELWDQRDHLVKLDVLDDLELMEHLDFRVTQERKDHVVLPAFQEAKVQWDPLDLKVNLVRLVFQELQERQGLLEIGEHPELAVHKAVTVLMDTRVNLDLPEPQDLLVQQANLDLLVLLAVPVHQVFKDLLEAKDQMESLV